MSLGMYRTLSNFSDLSAWGLIPPSLCHKRDERKQVKEGLGCRYPYGDAGKPVV